MNNLTQRSDNLVECKNLSKFFYEGNYRNPILREVNFKLKSNERIAIVGASGSGKSTLLHILAGLDRPSEGLVSIMGQPIINYSTHQLSEIRNQHIGFVYQFHHLLPEFSLLENIAMPLLIRGEKKALAHHKALKTLEQLNLSHRAHHRPGEASGGERQRAAVGRAIITEPAFILADEPTGNLDSASAHAIIDILCHLTKTSVVIVTHDHSIAARMDKTFQLEDGHLMPFSHPKKHNT